MEKILIYTDGGCLGNPGPGGWGAIISGPGKVVTELGGFDAPTTNNRMEMTAILEALRSLGVKAYSIELYSDSKYSLQGISEWRYGWQKRNWTNQAGKEVLNKELWQEMCKVVDALKAAGSEFVWKYVPGHQGIPGNERVDTIAQSFSRQEHVELYRGQLVGYAVDLSPPPPSQLKKSKSKSKSSSGKAFAYCSFVGGEFHVDKTWKACEARVKGRSGAKFKKAFSAAEVDQLRVQWGG